MAAHGTEVALSWRPQKPGWEHSVNWFIAGSRRCQAPGPLSGPMLWPDALHGPSGLKHLPLQASGRGRFCG